MYHGTLVNRERRIKMSIGDRGFVEFLVAKINEKGVISSGYSEEEIRRDIVDMIWEAYEEF